MNVGYTNLDSFKWVVQLNAEIELGRTDNAASLGIPDQFVSGASFALNLGYRPTSFLEVSVHGSTLVPFTDGVAPFTIANGGQLNLFTGAKIVFYIPERSNDLDRQY